MSDNMPGPEFWTRSNALVNLANDQCNDASPNEVSASTMYAAARFNAFLVATSTGSAQNMEAERERALAYFTDQFRKMMEDNFSDFITNFEAYAGPAPT